MNPVLILTRNNLELTKRCVESVRRQDIPTTINIIDNGSIDGTVDWLKSTDYASHEGNYDSACVAFTANRGVSHGWNVGLSIAFDKTAFEPAEYVLVINNDTVLPPWFYRELLGHEVPFVTGLAQSEMAEIAAPKTPAPLDPHPDFSAFLMRREAWETVGPFDERMKLYASDCDWHVRAHRKGITLWKASTSYYHERSSTMRLASEADRQEIQKQANEDRAFFRSLYGRIPGDPNYDELFR